MANESPIYDQCPTYCGTYEDERKSFCDSCPIGIARAEFREYCESELEQMPGPQFGYDYIYQCLVEVRSLGELPAEVETLTTARLRGILDSERKRIKRAKAWNTPGSHNADFSVNRSD